MSITFPNFFQAFSVFTDVFPFKNACPCTVTQTLLLLCQNSMKNSQCNPADRIYMIKNGEPGTGLNLHQSKFPRQLWRKQSKQRCNPEKSRPCTPPKIAPAILFMPERMGSLVTMSNQLTNTLISKYTTISIMT